MIGVMLGKVYTRKNRRGEDFVIQPLNQICVIKLQFFFLIELVVEMNFGVCS